MRQTHDNTDKIITDLILKIDPLIELLTHHVNLEVGTTQVLEVDTIQIHEVHHHTYVKTTTSVRAHLLKNLITWVEEIQTTNSNVSGKILKTVAIQIGSIKRTMNTECRTEASQVTIDSTLNVTKDHRINNGLKTTLIDLVTQLGPVAREVGADDCLTYNFI